MTAAFLIQYLLSSEVIAVALWELEAPTKLWYHLMFKGIQNFFSEQYTHIARICYEGLCHMVTIM